MAPKKKAAKAKIKDLKPRKSAASKVKGGIEIGPVEKLKSRLSAPKIHPYE